MKELMYKNKYLLGMIILPWEVPLFLLIAMIF